MILKCPKCKTELPYRGYPKNPNVSTVMCMTCGYTAPGFAFHRICDTCGTDYDIDDVTVREEKGDLTVTCTKCLEAKNLQEEARIAAAGAI